MRTRHAIWVALFTAVMLAGGCAQILGLDGDYHGADAGQGGAGGTPTCNTDSQCDDKNPCTTDTCGPDKLCVLTALADGPAPDQAQTAGDCKTILCVAGEPKDEPEDPDVPDDGEDCTIDGCNTGVPYHTAKADNTACDLMGAAGVCDHGACVVRCKTAADCPMTNPCQTPSCDGSTGTCAYANLPDGTPTPGVTPEGGPKGDCHVRICLNGADSDQVDDSDVPVTATDCDTEVCDNGTPTNPGKALDNPCSTFQTNQPGFCDGAGACRECAKDNECPGVTDDCQRPACVNFVCSTAFTPDNTPVTAQTPGDCHKMVCDGAGSTKSNVDDTDKPLDGTVCTNDICTNGTPSHTPNPGVTCETASSPFVCNAQGQCGCQNDGDCTSPNTCGGGNPGAPAVCGCTKTTCNAQFKTCGSISDACFGTLNCNNNNKNGGETDVDCGGPVSGCATRCAVGKTCNAGSDCASGFCVDGVCCNTACTGGCQACSAAKKGSGTNGTCGAIKAGTDPDAECNDDGATSCGNNGWCNGAGVCQLYASGTTCLNASCADPTTLNKAKTCNGTGTCVTPAPSTQGCAPYLCSSNVCAATCSNDAQCASGNYCSGGMCLTKKTQGTACGAANQCQSGFCVDGFCCDSACNGACQACSAAKKQSGATNGTCGNATDGQNDPRGICAAQAATTCGTDGKCSSGACENWASSTQCVGPSCSGSTLTTAKNCDGSGSCNQGGTTGACAGNYACANGTTCNTSCGTGAGASDAKCASGYYCDGTNGTCKSKASSGGVCTADGQCSSGFCLGGFCCGSASCPAGSVGCAATACASGTGACVYPGSSTSCGANSCSSAQITTTSCDGAGNCVADAPAACANHLTCQSGTACRTSCGTSDVSCVSGYYCDGVGAGACQQDVANGGACTAANQCSSGVCGTSGTGNCCVAACTTSGVCGATSCSGTGGCVGPSAATSCSTCSGSTLTAGTCSGSGTCNAGAPAACANNLKCQDATQCWASCLTGGNPDNTKCANGTCNGGTGKCQ